MYSWQKSSRKSITLREDSVWFVECNINAWIASGFVRQGRSYNFSSIFSDNFILCLYFSKLLQNPVELKWNYLEIFTKISNFWLITISPLPKYKALFLNIAFDMLLFRLKRAYLQNIEPIYVKLPSYRGVSFLFCHTIDDLRIEKKWFRTKLCWICSLWSCFLFVNLLV